MGQEPGAGAAAGNRVIRRRRCDDGIAGAAGQLCTDVSDDLEPARHVIECFGGVLADPTQRAAAGGAGARRPMPHLFARQVLRQRAPGRLLRSAPRPEAVAEPQEVRLVDRIQHLGHRALGVREARFMQLEVFGKNRSNRIVIRFDLSLSISHDVQRLTESCLAGAAHTRAYAGRNDGHRSDLN
jgi:hypothetical protein